MAPVRVGVASRSDRLSMELDMKHYTDNPEERAMSIAHKAARHLAPWEFFKVVQETFEAAAFELKGGTKPNGDADE